MLDNLIAQLIDERKTVTQNDIIRAMQLTESLNVGESLTEIAERTGNDRWQLRDAIYNRGVNRKGNPVEWDATTKAMYSESAMRGQIAQWILTQAITATMVF